MFPSRLLEVGQKLSQDLSSVTFISIHVRRTDYSNHMHGLFNLTYVDTDYFRRAIDHFRGKYDARLTLVSHNRLDQHSLKYTDT